MPHVRNFADLQMTTESLVLTIPKEYERGQFEC